MKQNGRQLRKIAVIYIFCFISDYLVQANANICKLKREKNAHNEWRWVLPYPNPCECTKVVMGAVDRQPAIRSFEPVHAACPFLSSDINAIRRHYSLTCDGKDASQVSSTPISTCTNRLRPSVIRSSSTSFASSSTDASTRNTVKEEADFTISNAPSTNEAPTSVEAASTIRSAPSNNEAPTSVEAASTSSSAPSTNEESTSAEAASTSSSAPSTNEAPTSVEAASASSSAPSTNEESTSAEAASTISSAPPTQEASTSDAKSSASSSAISSTDATTRNTDVTALAATTRQPETAAGYLCDEDWEQFGGFCYYYNGNGYSFDEAEKECTQLDGHLISIHSEEEQEFIASTFVDTNFWIGLSDQDVEGVYVWIDGTDFDYSNWRPNDEPKSTDCTFMNQESTWDQVDCTYNREYACKTLAK